MPRAARSTAGATRKARKAPKGHGGAREGGGRPKTVEQGRTISVFLPDDLVSMVRSQAERNRCSMSAQVRRLLEAGLGLPG